MTRTEGEARPFVFEGFDTLNGTIVPDVFFDFLAPELTDCELRVLLYLMRRIFGFKRESDDISISQLADGLVKGSRQLDRGTQMSKSSVKRGLAGLRLKGVVVAVRNTSAARGNEPTTYTLRFRGQPLDTGEDGTETPLGSAVGQAPPGSAVNQAPLAQQRTKPLGSAVSRARPATEPHKKQRERTTGVEPDGSTPPLPPPPAADPEEEADEPDFYVPLVGEGEEPEAEPAQGPVIVELPKEPNYAAGFMEFVKALNEAGGRRFEARDQQALRKYTELRRQYERSGGTQGYSHAMLLAVARGAAMDPNRQENRQYMTPLSVLRSTIIQSLYQWGAGIEPPPPPRNGLAQANGHGPVSTGRPINRTEANVSRAEELRARAAALRAQQAAREAEGGGR